VSQFALARISYDERTAAAYKAVREVPRDGLLVGLDCSGVGAYP
jgi:hypothetical protein